ncbi:hypothetical protein J7J13_03045 [bacterium]|nr:hypothetical protein [bacterium]
MFTYYSISAFINFLVSFLLGIFVLHKNRKEKLNRILSFWCFTVAFWSFFYFIWQIETKEQMALLWTRLLMLGAVWVPVAFLQTVVIFLKIEKEKKYLIIFSYILSSVFTFLLFTPLMVKKVEPTAGFEFWPKPGIAYIPFLVMFAGLSIYAVLLAYKSLKKETSPKIKLQIKYILFGMAISITAGSTNYFLWYDINIPPYGNILASTYVIFTVYVIIRHHLLNIKVIATEILSLGILLVSVVHILAAENFIKLVINLIIFIILLVFIIMLVRSVENEVRRKEELQKLTKKLAKANRKLKQLDRAKSEFISIASHQLRTPLGTVKGFVSLLMEGSYGEISEKVKEVLKKISTSNERLLSLVNDLLDLSRIEAGKMQYDFDYWQIEDIVQEIKDMLLLKAKEKGLYLKVDFPSPPLPKIRIDGAKIREVISNLVENAIKYTKRGGVEVNFKQENNLVRIIVSDTGIGIPQDEMLRLFSKFSRGKNVGRIDTDGTGLGLFVGRKIVKAHKGRIWAESEGENKGSRFIIELLIDGVEKEL